MKYEAEIRKVLALQKQVAETQSEVSRILRVIKEDKSVTANKFVIDGKIWEIDRWPLEGAVTREYFHTWCLKFAGDVIQ
jgi:hypothetical protein